MPVVISYSSKDFSQIRVLVRLLKAAMRDLEGAVFWDEQIAPGKPWFEEMKRLIDSGAQLFVFWCHHSRNSDQVKLEFDYALRNGKKVVVPVLLDNTPLAPELRPISGIDLRGTVRHSLAMWRQILSVAAALSFVVLLAIGLWSARPSVLPPTGEVGRVTIKTNTIKGSQSDIRLDSATKARLDTFATGIRRYPHISIGLAAPANTDSAFAGSITAYLENSYNMRAVHLQGMVAANDRLTLLAFTDGIPSALLAAPRDSTIDTLNAPFRPFFEIPLVAVLFAAIWRVGDWKRRKRILSEFQNYLMQ